MYRVDDCTIVENSEIERLINTLVSGLEMSEQSPACIETCVKLLRKYVDTYKVGGSVLFTYSRIREFYMRCFCEISDGISKAHETCFAEINDCYSDIEAINSLLYLQAQALYSDQEVESDYGNGDDDDDCEERLDVGNSNPTESDEPANEKPSGEDHAGSKSVGFGGVENLGVTLEIGCLNLDHDVYGSSPDEDNNTIDDYIESVVGKAVDHITTMVDVVDKLEVECDELKRLLQLVFQFLAPVKFSYADNDDIHNGILLLKKDYSFAMGLPAGIEVNDVIFCRAGLDENLCALCYIIDTLVTEDTPVVSLTHFAIIELMLSTGFDFNLLCRLQPRDFKRYVMQRRNRSYLSVRVPGTTRGLSLSHFKMSATKALISMLDSDVEILQSVAAEENVPISVLFHDAEQVVRHLSYADYTLSELAVRRRDCVCHMINDYDFNDIMQYIYLPESEWRRYIAEGTRFIDTVLSPSSGVVRDDVVFGTRPIIDVDKTLKHLQCIAEEYPFVGSEYKPLPKYLPVGDWLTRAIKAGIYEALSVLEYSMSPEHTLLGLQKVDGNLLYLIESAVQVLPLKDTALEALAFVELMLVCPIECNELIQLRTDSVKWHEDNIVVCDSSDCAHVVPYRCRVLKRYLDQVIRPNEYEYLFPAAIIKADTSVVLSTPDAPFSLAHIIAQSETQMDLLSMQFIVDSVLIGTIQCQRSISCSAPVQRLIQV